MRDVFALAVTVLARAISSALMLVVTSKTTVRISGHFR